MKLSIQTMIGITILILVLMIIISLLLFISGRERRSLHMVEFWISFIVFGSLSYWAEELGPKYVVLSTFSFIWSVNAITKVCSDVAHQELQKRWHLPFMMSSYLVSMGLMFFDFDFSVYASPGTFAVAFVGFSVTYRFWRCLTWKKATLMHYLFLLNLIILFAHLLDFPFLRLDPDFKVAGYGIALVNVLLMAVILPALSVYELQLEQRRILEIAIRSKISSR